MWLALGGGVLALVVSLGVAYAIKMQEHPSTAPPPASTGGLVVQAGPPPAPAQLDPGQPLRCFVAGQFVGSMSLAQCASRNGVATDALDVGVDQSGALGAGAGAQIMPLPPPSAVPPPAESAAAAQVAETQVQPAGDCLRYAGSAWRKVGGDLTLSACVQALFAGHCEGPGGASYGHWMAETLRLSPHRVEISGDNRNFRTVVQQNDQGCTIPAF
jgi:hypothetical protein